MTNEANWVRARANCTLEWIFLEITTEMGTDIKGFNDLPPQNRRDRLFDSTLIRDSGLKVSRVSQNPVGDMVVVNADDFVLVEKTSTHITAKRTGHDSLTITPRWNEETLLCDLLVGGRPLSVWQISQRILGDFFFG